VLSVARQRVGKDGNTYPERTRAIQRYALAIGQQNLMALLGLPGDGQIGAPRQRPASDAVRLC
jgi:hypothetical protein